MFPAEHASGWEQLPLPQADIRYAAQWLPADEAQSLFEQLKAEIPWSQHRLQLFGREVDAPRLSCWIGDPGASYTYSRRRFEPLPWTPTLRLLRQRLEQACDARFNSVLANLYRDGHDSMGWHSDDEPELGPAPVIASLSLGALRRFRLRARRGDASTHQLPLSPGSLLYMGGATQQHYRHEIPKEGRGAGPRINLTFRWVVPASV